MKRSVKELALSGVMAALGVVLLCLGGMVPFALYICPILASGVLAVVREECRAGYAWCCYGAIAVLGMVLGPDKEASALFLFLGYYPLLRPRLETIRPAAVRWLIKLALAAAAVGAMYALLLHVFQLADLTAELANAAPWMFWSTVAMGALLFIAYDVSLGRFAAYYRRRKRSG